MRALLLALVLTALACAPEGPERRCDTGCAPEGPQPAGTIGPTGGSVDRLWFAFTGDTRPAACDASDQYPRSVIARIAASMKALDVQFALDLGDHMYVCNQSDAEAAQQMGYYMAAIAQGPATFWMTMGNHECGAGSCSVGGPHDANFAAYMAVLRRPQPWYAADVTTSLGLARFVVVADDAWSPAQAAWLESALSEADVVARYTIVARHHPVTGTRTGNPEILAALRRHALSLILSGHDHEYRHDAVPWGGRSAVMGLGWAPSSMPPGFGTVRQNADGTLTFVRRDASGNPVGVPWSVTPR